MCVCVCVCVHAKHISPKSKTQCQSSMIAKIISRSMEDTRIPGNIYNQTNGYVTLTVHFFFFSSFIAYQLF